MHFDEIAVGYDKARWEYPPELYADIGAYRGVGAGRVALEIGAGTGKATAPMLTAGYEVTAVELGGNMADFLLGKFAGDNRFSVVVSAFEEAELAEDGYDVVYAASAFHWVDPEVGCPKVFRLLKSGGIFALFRNNPDPVGGAEIHEALQALYEEHYLSAYPNNVLPQKYDRLALAGSAEIKRGFGFSDMEQYGFTDITMRFYKVTHTYDAQGYIALLETYADHRGLPETNKAALYAGIEEVIERHGGVCHQDCLFQLYMGRKP